MSPYLLSAARGSALSISSLGLAHGKLNLVSLREILERDRRDQVAFPRRLQLYCAINIIRTRAILKTTGRMCEGLYLCSNYLSGIDAVHSTAVRSFMLRDDPTWMLRLSAWICHDRDVRRRRLVALRTFDRRRFKYEFDVLADNFFFPLNTMRHFVLYLHSWEVPALSFGIYFALIVAVWHDLSLFIIPAALLSFAVAITLYGALPSEVRRKVQSVCVRPRTAPGRTILEKLRNFRDDLANNQVRMHKINDVILRLRSLYSWRDPGRTRVFILGLLIAAGVIALVPAKYLLLAFLLLQITKPLRSPAPGLATLALRRFWDGLPVPDISDPVYETLPDDIEDLLQPLAPEALATEMGGGGGGAMAGQQQSQRRPASAAAAGGRQLLDGVNVLVMR